MPVLSKPPTGRARREDAALVPSITIPLSPTVEEESESDIEVVHSPTKVAVHEEDKAITPPLENNDPAIVDAFVDDEEITPPPEHYDPALVNDQGIFLTL